MIFNEGPYQPNPFKKDRETTNESAKLFSLLTVGIPLFGGYNALLKKYGTNYVSILKLFDFPVPGKRGLYKLFQSMVGPDQKWSGGGIRPFVSDINQPLTMHQSLINDVESIEKRFTGLEERYSKATKNAIRRLKGMNRRVGGRTYDGIGDYVKGIDKIYESSQTYFDILSHRVSSKNLLRTVGDNFAQKHNFKNIDDFKENMLAMDTNLMRQYKSALENSMLIEKARLNKFYDETKSVASALYKTVADTQSQSGFRMSTETFSTHVKSYVDLFTKLLADKGMDDSGGLFGVTPSSGKMNAQAGNFNYLYENNQLESLYSQKGKGRFDYSDFAKNFNRVFTQKGGILDQRLWKDWQYRALNDKNGAHAKVVKKFINESLLAPGGSDEAGAPLAKLVKFAGKEISRSGYRVENFGLYNQAMTNANKVFIKYKLKQNNGNKVFDLVIPYVIPKGGLIQWSQFDQFPKAVSLAKWGGSAEQAWLQVVQQRLGGWLFDLTANNKDLPEAEIQSKVQNQINHAMKSYIDNAELARSMMSGFLAQTEVGPMWESLHPVHKLKALEAAKSVDNFRDYFIEQKGTINVVDFGFSNIKSASTGKSTRVVNDFCIMTVKMDKNGVPKLVDTLTVETNPARRALKGKDALLAKIKPLANEERKAAQQFTEAYLGKGKAKTQQVETEHELMNVLKSYLSKGKHRGKFVAGAPDYGDIPSVRAAFGKPGQIKNALDFLPRFHSREFFDINTFKALQTHPFHGATKGDNIKYLIKELLQKMNKVQRAEGIKAINAMIEPVLPALAPGHSALNFVLDEERVLMHYSKVDTALELAYMMLIGFYDYDKGLSKSAALSRLENTYAFGFGKRVNDLFKNFDPSEYMDSFGSSNKLTRGIRTFFNAETFDPLYKQANRARSIYQMGNASPLGNNLSMDLFNMVAVPDQIRKSKMGGNPIFMKSGAEQMWQGYSDYWRNFHMLLLGEESQLGYQQSAVISKQILAKNYESKISVIKVSADGSPYAQEKAIIMDGDVVGSDPEYSGGKKRYSGQRGVPGKVISTRENSDGTISLVIDTQQRSGLGQPWLVMHQKVGINVVAGLDGVPNLPHGIDFVHHYDFRKKFDNDILIRVYLGKIAHASEHLPKAKNLAVQNEINRQFKGFVTTKMSSEGFLKFEINTNALSKSSASLDMYDIGKKMGKIYKVGGFDQSKQMSKISGYGGFFASMMNKNKKAWHEKGATTIAHHLIGNAKDLTENKDMQNFFIGFYEPWMGKDGYATSTKQLKKIMAGYHDTGAYSQLIEQLKLMPNKTDVIWSTLSKKAVVSQLMIEIAQASSMEPGYAIGQNAKVSLAIVENIGQHKGGAKLAEYFTRTILQQQYHRLGAIHATMVYGHPNSPYQLPGSVDYLQLINQGLKAKDTSALHRMVKNFLTLDDDKTLSFSKLSERITEMNFFHNGSGLVEYTEDTKSIFENLYQKDKTKIIDGRDLLRGKNMFGKLAYEDSYELLAKNPTGVFRFKGTAQFVVSNSGKMAPLNRLQFMNNELTPVTFNIDGETHRMVAASTEAQTGRNVLTKAISGVPGVFSDISNYLQYLRNIPVKQNFQAHIPGSFHSLAQTTGLYDLGRWENVLHGRLTGESAKKAAEYYSKSLSTLPFEVIQHVNWSSKKGAALLDQVSNVGYEDIELVAKYMQTPTMDRNLTHPLTRTAAFAETKLAELGGGEVLTAKKILDSAHNKTLRKISISKLRKAYAGAVQNKLMPALSAYARNPSFDMGTVTPVMAYFTDDARLRGQVDNATLLVSRFIDKISGTDHDFDQSELFTIPSEMREFWEGFYSKGGDFEKVAKLKSGGENVLALSEEISSSSGRQVQIFDTTTYKTRVVSIEQYAELSNTFKKKSSIMNKVFQNMKGPEATGSFQEELLAAPGGTRAAQVSHFQKLFIKYSPASSVTFLKSLEGVMADPKYESSRDFLLYKTNIGKIAEWGIKQKSAHSFNPLELLMYDVQNIHEEANFTRLNNWVNGKSVNYDTTKMPGFQPMFFGVNKSVDNPFPVEADKTGFSDLFKTKIYGNKAMLRDMGPMSKKEAERVTFLEWMQVIGKRDKFIWKGMSPKFRHFSSGTTIDSLSAASNINLGPGMALLQKLISVQSTENPFLQSNSTLSHIGKDLAKRMGEQTIKNAQNAGSVLGVMALGYAATQFFQPDQMKTLGHMPGRGGDYWDHSKTINEMEAYKPFMETPMGNPHDLPKAYLELFDAREAERNVMRANSKSYNTTITRRNDYKGSYHSNKLFYAGSLF